MEFEDIIKEQRESYINQLKSFYENRNEGVKELLIKLNGEDEVLIFNLIRLEYLVKINGVDKIEEFSPGTYKNHQPITFFHEQLLIELHPFFWHGCEFVINQEFNDFDWLKSWTKTYIDEEDAFENDANGFSGAIHSVTFPTKESTKTKFSVDFGTSTTDAFMSLVNLIKDAGAKQLTINSSDLMNE